MFSIVKLRDALTVVREQKASFVESTKEVFKETSSFRGELEYSNSKHNSLGFSYSTVFKTTLSVEKISATITMYLSAHESLEHFYRLKEIKISVPELAIEEYVPVGELGLKDEFKIHSITPTKTSELHIKAKVIPY